ncbi:beta-hexosaminidase beta chain [Lasius niger]|uniref:Beta-hexosaminidase beta chain n=1 Tax=Lasius niger TaxID=67767 RepID=A0A0J7K915_LASNI|nr:beta-hexosaminidase beta chain [Lasius niger]
MFNLPQQMWIFHRPKMHVMQINIAVVRKRSLVGKKYFIEKQGIVLDLSQSPFTEMHTIHKIIPMQSLVKANMVRMEFMSMQNTKYAASTYPEFSFNLSRTNMSILSHHCKDTRFSFFRRCRFHTLTRTAL